MRNGLGGLFHLFSLCRGPCQLWLLESSHPYLIRLQLRVICCRVPSRLHTRGKDLQQLTRLRLEMTFAKGISNQNVIASIHCLAIIFGWVKILLLFRQSCTCSSLLTLRWLISVMLYLSLLLFGFFCCAPSNVVNNSANHWKGVSGQ